MLPLPPSAYISRSVENDHKWSVVSPCTVAIPFTDRPKQRRIELAGGGEDVHFLIANGVA